MKPTHDLAVKVGTYVDRDGNTKGRYENVGVVFEDRDGKPVIAIKRTFNPAGVLNPDGKAMVLLSQFPIRPRDDAPQPRREDRGAAPRPGPDDEIPF